MAHFLKKVPAFPSTALNKPKVETCASVIFWVFRDVNIYIFVKKFLTFYT